MVGLSGAEMKSALNDMPLIKDGDAVLDVTRTEENGGLKYTIEFNSTLGRYLHLQYVTKYIKACVIRMY